MRPSTWHHRWNVTPKQAVEIQRELATRVERRGTVRTLGVVAGADAAFTPDKEQCIAAVVAWDVRTGVVLEQHVVRRALRFPYVPGLLSFREAPALLAAIRKLTCVPDAFLFDGQGYAHPRRFGLACHVGVLIDHPCIGCAKSVLVGSYEEPAAERGATAPLIDRGEHVGLVVRTRSGVKPVFVSVGHRVSLSQAVKVVLQCCVGYRLPEPTRLADQLVARNRLKSH